ncbi:MAG: Bax inhibitor-1/YccA family protein [Ardenticatenales bacterium]|nr:Bax inhibitor-1/YccA family protein [Ardenticatenales bacterium]
MRTANPALNEKTFREVAVGTDESRMTLEGTINKTVILLFLLVLTASAVWIQTAGDRTPQVMPWVIGGSIGGLVMAIITAFRKEWSPFTTPIYALLEGLALGGLSVLFELEFPGIVIQAVALTFGVLLSLLVAYRTGLIRATDNFKRGVVAATGAIMLIYLAGLILRLFGIGIPYIHESGPIGIAFSLVVVTVAALNLVLDFDFIEHGVEQGAPKFMEWYAAFGLIVTLVWLYLELLRLLSKLRKR